MGLWADLKHIAGNMIAINQRYDQICKRILEEHQVDIRALPDPLKTQLYNMVKSDFLDGGGKYPIDSLVNQISLLLIGAGVTRRW